MLYRVLKTLSLGEDKELRPTNQTGQFTRLEWLNEGQVARLMAVGAVSEAAPPPLAELPDWGGRAERLAQVGIHDAAQFLEADPETIAKAMKVKAATIVRWQGEARKWLTVEPKRG